MSEPLNLLTAWSMLLGKDCRFVEGRDRFDDLLKMPVYSQDMATITLNYDVLLEEALLRISDYEEEDDVYYYPGFCKPNDDLRGIPIFKIHGSVNWLRQFPVAVSSTLKIAQESRKRQPSMTLSGPDNVPDTQMEYCPKGGRKNLVLELKHDGSARDPILGIYARGKPIPYNWNCIDRVRNECVEVISNNLDADVTIIGVHIPPKIDDPFLHEVLQALSRVYGNKIYVGPDKIDRSSAESLGFSPDCLYLHELIKK